MKFKLAAAGVLAVLVQASHASAGIGTVTYLGYVLNTQVVSGVLEAAPDVDNADLFGGGDLEFDPIEATFVYDTQQGFDTTDGSTFDELDGGSTFFTSSPLLSATFTVVNQTTMDEYTYNFTPDFYADVTTSTGTGNYNYIQEIAYSSAGDQTITYIEPDAPAPASLDQPFFGTGDGSGSYFNPGATNTGMFDSIVFDPLEVSVSYVPEPGAWALMIAGLGLTGAALRRGSRRRRIA
jgi:hypothetical protein